MSTRIGTTMSAGVPASSPCWEIPHLQKIHRVEPGSRSRPLLGSCSSERSLVAHAMKKGSSRFRR